MKSLAIWAICTIWSVFGFMFAFNLNMTTDTGLLILLSNMVWYKAALTAFIVGPVFWAVMAIIWISKTIYLIYTLIPDQLSVWLLY